MSHIQELLFELLMEDLIDRVNYSNPRPEEIVGKFSVAMDETTQAKVTKFLESKIPNCPPVRIVTKMPPVPVATPIGRESEKAVEPI